MTAAAAPEGENERFDVDLSVKAEASSAHSRLNIPLNLNNWKHLPQAIQEQLLWFHQYCLDHALPRKACAEAVGYDWSTVYRVLTGIYEGNYENFCQAVASFKRLIEARSTIQQNEFVHNRLTKLIFGGLNYALANNSMTLITGESRSGKTVTGREWQRLNNHGRSVFVTAPAYGGTKWLVMMIAQAVGVNKNLAISGMIGAIYRAFNPNRILIIDEAHRLLPNDRRVNPVSIELLRDIHDQTGCALALLATQRFDTELRKSEYMFEQVLGRIGMPIRLPRKISESDILPIITQYVKKPSAKLLAKCLEVSNGLGRLGILVEILKVASRMAVKSRAALDEQMVFKAFALRREMSGEQES
jgi:DNA transposition AAA+ family ATPase